MRNLKLYFLRFNKEETGKFESGSLEATKGVEINDYTELRDLLVKFK